MVKRLGFPELQEASKPSSILSKALDSVMKRLKQLGEVRGMYAKLVINEPKEPDENKDKQVRPEQELQKKTRPQL